MATSLLDPVSTARNNQIVMNPDPANPVVKNSQDPNNSQNFMKLMIEQLKAQDPLSPMQSAEMTQQLASLNSLEQLVSINQLLSGQNKNSGLSQATALIGKYVEGMDANSQMITGVVDRVDMVEGLPVLKVDDKVLLLDQVTTVDDTRPVLSDTPSLDELLRGTPATDPSLDGTQSGDETAVQDNGAAGDTTRTTGMAL